MNRKQAAVLAGILLAAVLYLLPLGQRGLVGPDEPRYASIAREMVESGDWVTPTLWGEPWFEKPAMLFWLGALGYAVGMDEFVRLPVALLSLGFLAFFWWNVRKAFGEPTAIAATCVLGTSAGWVAYAEAAVFDAPVTVFTSAAVLSLLPWVQDPETENRTCIAWFGGLLGLGMLSKGLVAPVVASCALVPVLCAKPRRVLDLLSPSALIPFSAVCLPWYAACYWLNGRVFLDEFIVRHHLERFISSSLQHVQPWWFFGPVVLGFLLPWTPLLFCFDCQALWREPRLRFLAAWALGPLVFFSLSVNKLPGYVLPVVPPLAILLAVQWRRSKRSRLLLAVAGTLSLVPLAGTLLPPALADGITRAWSGLPLGSLAVALVAGLGVAGLAVLCALKPREPRALPAVAAASALALALLKMQVYPAASRLAGVREFYQENRSRVTESCMGDLRRHVVYGIRHYSRDTVPRCEAETRPIRLEGSPPRFVRGSLEKKGGAASPRPIRRVPPSPRQGRSAADAGGPG